MDILKLIKKRRTIRKYKNEPIKGKLLYKILEAARWAPSAHNSQSWRFIIIKNSKLKEKLTNILSRVSEKFLTSVKILLKESIKIIEKAPIVILVYNNHSFSKKIYNLGEPYKSIAYMSEIESISAAIQNMQLMASSLGIGMAWLMMPVLAKEGIKKLINTEHELIAVLTLGVPRETPTIPKRKKLGEIAKVL